jgi:hypothetical protein
MSLEDEVDFKKLVRKFEHSLFNIISELDC